MAKSERLVSLWGALLTCIIVLCAPLGAIAAPYAAMVVDARTGQVIHSRNADTRLHPASLTKMMTLYIVFEAIEHGEISLDTIVTIPAQAAAEPPSKLGLKAGQKIKLRYLIRAAAVKSANDAATAIGFALEGSEAAFARRMNRTAKALGMKHTTFKNAHGLTEAGHMSTARDMTTLGRHMIYDYPQYYNLFSRKSANAGLRQVPNTNRRFLSAYQGADGIKTGYTRAAGFNLVASARRGNERIITTVFGGSSTAQRNARVAELMDLGFSKAKSRVRVKPPAKPRYQGRGTQLTRAAPAAAPAKVRRVAAAPRTSLRPQARPVAAPVQVAAVEAAVSRATITYALEEAVGAAAATDAQPAAAPISLASAAPLAPGISPPARPASLISASQKAVPPPPVQEVVARVSTSSGRHWGINVGRYNTRYQAERVLLKVALNEIETLEGSLRKVASSAKGHDANFLGLSRDQADLACRRLNARGTACFMISP